MHWDKKRRIEKVHERAQKVLNLWKQEMSNQWLGTLLSTVFHHSSFVKELNEKFGEEVDDQYISKIDFKSMGISKSQVVDKLISEKILPNNFYQLTDK
jgi:sensor histidine kinase regulating citrate/malate metabolism